MESTNEQLSWEDSENSEFATINVNISLAILHAVVILMGDKVDLLESRFESEEVCSSFFFFFLFLSFSFSFSFFCSLFYSLV